MPNPLFKTTTLNTRRSTVNATLPETTRTSGQDTNLTSSRHRGHNNTKHTGGIRQNSRERRWAQRHDSLRATILQNCGLMPLTASEAEQHRLQVKQQFFADLAEWVRTSPTLARQLAMSWKFPAIIMSLGFLLGLAFGSMFAWVGLASVYAFGGWLKEAIKEASDTKAYRHEASTRIAAYAKWKVGQSWTCKPYEMFLLLSALKAPEKLQQAVLKIEARHPDAEFELETFDEDPILSVRRPKMTGGYEHYVLGAWGLPEKFTFR
ncbi:MAG: hypothetical protein AAB391_01610 [Patescibacteria group bacterium]